MNDYAIKLDDKFGQLTWIDLAREAAAHEPWFNQTLTTVNDAVVRLGVLHGEFQWHKHDHDDEFCLVLDGELVIEVEGREAVRLGPQPGFTMPKGILHQRSDADGRSDGRACRRRANGRLTGVDITRSTPQASRPARWPLAHRTPTSTNSAPPDGRHGSIDPHSCQQPNVERTPLIDEALLLSSANWAGGQALGIAALQGVTSLL